MKWGQSREEQDAVRQRDAERDQRHAEEESERFQYQERLKRQQHTQETLGPSTPKRGR